MPCQKNNAFHYEDDSVNTLNGREYYFFYLLQLNTAIGLISVSANEREYGLQCLA